MQAKKQQLKTDMEKWTGSKLGKEYIKAAYCHPAYLTYIQSTWCEMLGGMNNKLESRLLGEISTTSDTPPKRLLTGISLQQQPGYQTHWHGDAEVLIQVKYLDVFWNNKWPAIRLRTVRLLLLKLYVANVRDHAWFHVQGRLWHLILVSSFLLF